MIQLDLLSGSKAGHRTVVRQFPFRVGRSPHNQLRIEDAGVWEDHLEFSVRPEEGFVLTVSPETATLLNGERVQTVVLRNGDIIDAGSVKIRFGLSTNRQTALKLRETITWIALAALCFAQVALIYWLID